MSLCRSSKFLFKQKREEVVKVVRSLDNRINFLQLLVQPPVPVVRRGLIRRLGRFQAQGHRVTPRVASGTDRRGTATCIPVDWTINPRRSFVALAISHDWPNTQLRSVFGRSRRSVCP